jgi:NADPH-dependent 2,4-dienoyl-CoA reductase/sulfur reductase-like enzyme
MIGDEAPVDRPNVSKDFLAGTAPDEWMPLRPLDFYRDSKIDFVSGLVRAIDPAAKKVSTGDRELSYGALLYAPGAEPARLPIEGATLPHVHTIRTLADAQVIIGKLPGVRRVVAIGASFIALEAAASLRARGLEVTVVAPDRVPLERVLGAEVGGCVQKLHEANGVVLRLGRKPASIDPTHVTLDDGTRLAAELVIMGTGVRPRLDLAKSAGLAIDGGVVVDERLRTTADGVYAAGDVARFPYRGARAHRALGARRATRAARRTGHARIRRPVPRRPVLLERPLRRDDPLHGTLGEGGRDRGRRKSRRARRDDLVQRVGPAHGGRDDRPRSRGARSGAPPRALTRDDPGAYPHSTGNPPLECVAGACRPS